MPPVVSPRSMVATSHPLAVQAAVELLDQGGTAADAAVAAAAVLTVVDPRSTGIGGDLFAQFWSAGDTAPIALSASGPAPGGMSVDAVRGAGFDQMPAAGPWTVTVPGSVAGWSLLLERFGKLGLARALQAAIRIAEEGFEVARFVAEEWATGVDRLNSNAAATRLFLPGGRPPRAGERFANPELGALLRDVADSGPDVFYRGEFADRAGDAVQRLGGPLRRDDLAGWAGPEWVTPISVDYRGIRLYQVPPPGQGLIALQALALYDRLDLNVSDPAADDHAAIESLKLAFADAAAFIADPHHADVPTTELLSRQYLDERAKLIRPDQAIDAMPGSPGDTVYVAVVDEHGAGCSLIQSVYEGFGSGVVVPGTGVTLQNRGAGFVLDDDHPNRPEPGKRPYHTIIPAMLGRDDAFFGCLGVVGGFMQPQGQFQIVRNLVDRRLDPQTALDAPRLRFLGGRKVGFEPSYDPAITADLARRGHDVVRLSRFEAGGAQLVIRQGDRYLGASDPRKDGIAAGQ